MNQTARRKPGTGAELGGARMGLGVAAQPPHALQPRVGRSGGRPGPSARSTSGGTSRRREWTGYDEPDFIVEPPAVVPSGAGARGHRHASRGIDPFIMKADGKAGSSRPPGCRTVRCPTHYEPQESIVQNPLYGQQCNPARMEWRRARQSVPPGLGRPAFPVCAHHLSPDRAPHRRRHEPLAVAGCAELQPEMFCEVSPELAAREGAEERRLGDHHARRAREIEARVLVTRAACGRCGSSGRIVHQIGLPYHWGSKGLVRGDSANELISFVADPNVSIQESKALTGNIEAGRKSRSRRVRPAAARTGVPSREPRRAICRAAAAQSPIEQARRGDTTSATKTRST